MAKQLLEQEGITYTELKLDVHFTRDFLVERYPTAQTYPVVVVNGFYIGGATELAEYLETNSPRDTQLLNEG